MTGFGIGRCHSDDYIVEVQLVSVNHRHCQVTLRGDLRDVQLEDSLRKQLREGAQRGSICATVSVISEESEAGVDLDYLRSQYPPLAALARELGAPAPSLDALLSLCPRSRPSLCPEGLAPALQAALEEALQALYRLRAQEGAALAEDLGKRQQALCQLSQDMQERAAERAPAWRTAFTERLRGLLAQDIEAGLLARECAILADRIDISEELTRLASHLERFADLLQQPEDSPIGKALEFLLQELGREINTIGSKANDAELTNLVLDGKQILEQCREQVANVL